MNDTKMNEQDLQKKYMEFQMNEQQVKMINQQLEEITSKAMELDYIKQSLDEMSNVKENTEILAPLSSGIFIKANVQKTDELLVNVGSRTVVKKSIPETKKLMDIQLNEIENIREQLMNQLQESTIKSKIIEQELSKLSGV